MIDSYLKSLAATVRDLVASGKAVHVTHETAPELDLLAELPWKDCLKEIPPTDDPCVMDVLMLEPITLADLALGWLLASRALSQGQIWHDNEITCQEVLTSDRQRAAERAELALICERIQAEPIAHIKLADARIPIYRGMTGDLITQLLVVAGSGATASGNASQPSLSPYDGTREGARAAWAFVVESLQHRLRLRVVELDSQTFLGQAPIPLNDSQVAICDRYRRELEAM